MVKYIGEGRFMHGCLDRSFDEYIFKDGDDDVEVTVFLDGEIEVTWAGALDFSGNKSEFEKIYPDLSKLLW